MPTAVELYSVADVVGKTLYAKAKVPVYRDANDNAQPFGYVAAGQPVGVVFSWLDVNPAYNRSVLYWMFQATAGGFYYTKQIGGYYDVDALRAQGVITVEEKIEEEKEKADEASMNPIELMIHRYGKYAIYTIIGVVAVKAAIQKI